MTVTQMQHLLNFLGYDTGGVDGIYGPKTRQAVREFQEDSDGLEIDGEGGEATWKKLRQAVADGHSRKETPREPEKTGTYWDEIRHFVRQEFACRCGEYNPEPFCSGFPAEPEESLVRLADRVRSHFGAAAIPSSGLRCQRHNRDCGGVRNSRHLTGKALDFRVEGVSGERLLAYVQAQPETNYAYQIDGQYVHMDVI